MEIDGKVYKRKERLNEIFLVMQDVNHQLLQKVFRLSLISMKKENEEKALDILNHWTYYRTGSDIRCRYPEEKSKELRLLLL